MAKAKTPEENILVLQGGGALGAYQAGVYEELAEAGIEHRLDRRHLHRRHQCRHHRRQCAGASRRTSCEASGRGFRKTRWACRSSKVRLPRELANEAGASWIAAFGLPGFFSPRLLPPLFQPRGSEDALSIYDTAPLRAHAGTTMSISTASMRARSRLSVGAVNVRSGNFAYFDSLDQKLGPEHIMASGALPPGFPPVEIDGEFYWDGGLVSNTPLDYVMARDGCIGDAAIFQVDLFSARGPLPETFTDVFEREKDIRFSSRTRLNTDVARRTCQRNAAIQNLLAKLPDGLKNDPDASYLAETDNWTGALALVHLIYRSKAYETQSKDYLFSRRAVREHWAAGRHDAHQTLHHRDWLARPRGKPGISVYDLTREDEDA